MKVNPLFLAVALMLARVAPAAWAQEVPEAPAATDIADTATREWRLMASPLTWHSTYNPQHRAVYMLGLEKQYSPDLLLGGAYFRNSFGQPSGYAFAAHRFTDVAGYDPLFVEVSAGLIYGYVAPFNHKVPFDYKGFAPGAVLAAGWQLTPVFSAQVNLLGLSAVMFQLSVDF